MFICSYARFIISLKRDLVLHASGIIITHPFQVISIRMMAQFVGRETIYKYAIEMLTKSRITFDEIICYLYF